MASTYTLITSNVLGSSTTSVTFSSIPSTYKDLVLIISARTSRLLAFDDVYMRFNGVTSLYTNTYLRGSGTAVNSARNNTSSSMALVATANGNGATASTFGSLEIYIPNYLVAQNNLAGAFGVQEGNQTEMYMAISAVLSRTASAVTSIDLLPGTSTFFLTDSSFYLYGIKNS